jgi:hypothetical protein
VFRLATVSTSSGYGHFEGDQVLPNGIKYVLASHNY